MQIFLKLLNLNLVFDFFAHLSRMLTCELYDKPLPGVQSYSVIREQKSGRDLRETFQEAGEKGHFSFRELELKPSPHPLDRTSLEGL